MAQKRSKVMAPIAFQTKEARFGGIGASGEKRAAFASNSLYS